MLETLVDTTEMMKGAGHSAPVILVMWYMLKDLKKGFTELRKELSDLHSTVIPVVVKVESLEKTVAEHKADQLKINDDDRARLVLIESQLTAIWRQIGNRPGDKP